MVCFQFLFSSRTLIIKYFLLIFHINIALGPKSGNILPISAYFYAFKWRMRFVNKLIPRAMHLTMAGTSLGQRRSFRGMSLQNNTKL